MHNNGDRRGTMRASGEHGDAGCARALKAVITLIAVVAAIVSAPALARAEFPMAGLLVYCIGMGFIAMPLCLYDEWLKKRHAQDTGTVGP